MFYLIFLLRFNLVDFVFFYCFFYLIYIYFYLFIRVIFYDDVFMVYYFLVLIGCNFMEGFERWIEREDEEEYLDGLVESLEWFIIRGRKGERKGGIIMWRGMLIR